MNETEINQSNAASESSANFFEMMETEQKKATEKIIDLQKQVEKLYHDIGRILDKVTDFCFYNPDADTEEQEKYLDQWIRNGFSIGTKFCVDSDNFTKDEIFTIKGICDQGFICYNKYGKRYVMYQKYLDKLNLFHIIKEGE